ncbi:hypothetical protein [Chryseobacterium echinoideorum]|uniref:hypothetical protein n=1 Tax=Chryseobacterium echinoideorum TaxID=1549648 RepID=UPI001186FB38|nr:hypothetical protein [Chryseobacterium echinoideorum]
MRSNIFEKFIELIGWVQIFLSPFLIGAVISAIIYFMNPKSVTLIIAILILFSGAIIGAKLASKMYRSQEGTIGFISKKDSTPDIDKMINTEK